MKICPSCSFPNEERFPTCALCNTLIVDVPSTPSRDAANPEHEWRALNKKRHQATWREIAFANIFHSGIITLLAAFPGMVSAPQTLLFYCLSSLIVITSVQCDFTGQLTAPLTQGALSILLVAYFGPWQPFIFFMIAGHITFAALYWHWTDWIRSADR